MGFLMNSSAFLTFDDMYRVMLSLFPNCEIGEDNDGCLVIYPNMHMTDGGMLSDLEDPGTDRNEH